MTYPRFRTVRASLTTLSLATTVLAAVACSSAPESEPAASGSEAVTGCGSAADFKVHPECTPIDPVGPLPVRPVFQACQVATCDLFYAKGTAGYDPVVIPTSDPNALYVADPSFTAMLTSAGCLGERPVNTQNGSAWATAICPSSIAGAVSAYGAAHGDTAGTIACDTCTGDPTTAQIVVAWLIAEGTAPVCVPREPNGVPICTSPGGGCRTVSCVTY